MDADDALLAFVESYTVEKGYPPTMREMAGHLGMSYGSLYRQLERLRDEGRIRWTPELSRTIAVVGP